MFDHNANRIYDMSGLCLPVTSQEGAETVYWPDPLPEPNQPTEVVVCDKVRPVQQSSLPGSAHGRVESDEVTDSVICGHDANGSPVDDQLSRDLTEAARDAKGG